jgi:ABC-type bacteriocin/lantibiotic exporter with double-glycine peptidase domain
LQNLPSRVVEVFAVLGLFTLIVLAQWTGSDNHTYLLTIGAFMAAAYKIIPGIVKIINLAGQIKAYEFASEDYERRLEEKKKERNIVNSINTLQLKNASFHFNGIPAFRNVSLTMQRGDFVGIFGTSGRGKTTLFNVLLGFLPLQKGEISVNEEVACHHDLKAFWPSIAYVRQQCFLLHDTVLRNITLSEEACDQQRLFQALHVSGLEDMLLQSAEGLQKIITENGRNISGGQQQRIALARAIYKDADVFLLDEPFNELDEASEITLLNHFRHLANSGKIVVMITHNKEAASFFTQTICLDED